MIRFLTLICLAGAVSSQPQPPPWKPFQFFAGEWEGEGQGQSGVSKVERRYEFVLNGRFLEVRNKSVYAPQEKNPKGEVHEDRGLFSFDRGRKAYVFRQFHVEGFVNQFALPAAEAEAPSRTFVSESIENIPPGWRAKETYQIVNENEFIEIFELAGPGKDFEVYTRSRLRRKSK